MISNEHCYNSVGTTSSGDLAQGHSSRGGQWAATIAGKAGTVGSGLCCWHGGRHKQRPGHCPPEIWPRAVLRAAERRCLVPSWGPGPENSEDRLSYLPAAARVFSSPSHSSKAANLYPKHHPVEFLSYYKIKYCAYPTTVDPKILIITPSRSCSGLKEQHGKGSYQHFTSSEFSPTPASHPPDSPISSNLAKFHLVPFLPRSSLLSYLCELVTFWGVAW